MLAVSSNVFVNAQGINCSISASNQISAPLREEFLRSLYEIGFDFRRVLLSCPFPPFSLANSPAFLAFFAN